MHVIDSIDYHGQASVFLTPSPTLFRAAARTRLLIHIIRKLCESRLRN